MNINKPQRPLKYYMKIMAKLLAEKRRSALIPTIYCNQETADMLDTVLIVDYISKIK